MLAPRSIPPTYCPNIGGLSLGALRLWPAANVRRYPAPAGGRISQALELLDSRQYADVYFLDGSAGYDEEPGENEQGLFYKAKLVLLVPADAPDVSQAVATLAGGRYLVAFQDGNGRTKLAGTPEWPLRLLVGTETGKRPTDRNALQFSFAGELPVRAPFYLEQEINRPATRRAWSAGFSLDFS
ncbi:hypothetical protein [uncultured Hymenobacter sp.]|uniref:hypothetical protein n=1 Tax=uncultured Hymenobacter sp. TaxID=170016 RepID=UPI0035CB6607